MISIPLIVALLLAQTTLTSSSDSYCGFPEGATPYGPDNVCAPHNRIECESSSYQAITQCYWNNVHCTSAAVVTGEDKTCPNITNPTTCKKTRFIHNRHCVWYQAPTDRPSLFPSVDPTLSPSNVPSIVPSSSPSLKPTPLPTPRPTRSPPRQPTARRPTRAPTERPTPRPTRSPTAMPTANPSVAPTTTPSQIPSNVPSNIPSTTPSLHPSSHPSRSPTRVPSEEPTKYPSLAPSNVPTSNLSESPSTSPSITSFTTKIPIEKLVQVCRCNNELLCVDEPHVKGEVLNICGWAQHPVVLEMIWFLELSQYAILQTVVQDNQLGVYGGASLSWSVGSKFFVVSILVQNTFFEKPSSGVVANGRIRYSLNQRRRTDETIFVANDEEFTFRLEIPLTQPVDSGGVMKAVATDTDSDERNSKKSKNLRIWIPVAVAGAAAMGLLVFMFKVITTSRTAEDDDCSDMQFEFSQSGSIA